MRNTLLLFGVLIATSCSSPKEDVENYIRNEHPLVQSLEIIEIGKIDSMRSTNKQVLAANLLAYMIMDKSDYIEPHRYASRGTYDVPDSLYSQYDLVDSICTETMLYIDFNGHLERPYNTLGVEAKYRLNGNLYEDVFFYDNNGGISHSKRNIHKNFKELVSLTTVMYKTSIYE